MPSAPRVPKATIRIGASRPPIAWVTPIEASNIPSTCTRADVGTPRWSSVSPATSRMPLAMPEAARAASATGVNGATPISARGKLHSDSATANVGPRRRRPARPTDPSAPIRLPSPKAAAEQADAGVAQPEQLERRHDAEGRHEAATQDLAVEVEDDRRRAGQPSERGRPAHERGLHRPQQPHRKLVAGGGVPGLRLQLGLPYRRRAAGPGSRTHRRRRRASRARPRAAARSPRRRAPPPAARGTTRRLRRCSSRRWPRRARRDPARATASTQAGAAGRGSRRGPRGRAAAGRPRTAGPS